MKVAVWCPSCSQKYSVSQEHLEKRMRCKKCSHAFLGRDSTRPPSDRLPPRKTSQPNPTMSRPVLTDQPVEAELVTAELVQAKPAGEDISQYLIGGSAGATAVGPASTGLGGYPSPEPASRHVSNPWMIPAVLAAIILPLLLAVVSFLGRAVHDVGAVANQLDEKARAESNDDRPERADRPVVPDNNSMPVNPLPVNPFEIDTGAPTGDNGSSRSGNSGFTENKSRKKSPAEIRAEEAERATAELSAKRLAEKARAEKEIRDREREIANKAREARRDKERIEREKRELAREEAKRIESEAKEHLAAMELAAKEKPLDGLMSQMKVEGWGAKGLAISNEGMLYATTPDNFIVFDSKKGRVVSSTKKLGAIDRFSTVSLSDDGSMLAVGGDQGIIELYDLSRGKPKSVQSYGGHNSSITYLAFNSEGTHLMSFDRKHGVCFWDVNEESCIKKIEDFGTKLLTFHVDSKRNSITLAGSKKWSEHSFADGEVLKDGEFPFHMGQHASYSGDGTRMLGSAGGGVEAHKLDEKEELYRLKSSGVQWTIANVNDEKILVGGNRMFYLWNLTSQELLKVWSVPDVPYIQKIEASPDGSLVAVTQGGARDDIFVFKLDED